MVPPVARKFIAGMKVSHALDAAREANDDGLVPILNYLGEHHSDLSDVDDTVDEYELLIESLAEDSLTAELSFKPTQLGLDIDESVFRDNVWSLVEKATDNEIFVWIDMEEAETVDTTLDVYEELVTDYPGQVGICLQANLRRTMDDLHRVSQHDGAAVRLVKGAYSESNEITYPNAETVDKVYENLISLAVEFYLDKQRVAVGTHDEEMIDFAIDAEEQYDGSVEFQMLRGVRDEKQRELADDHQVCQYIPYGESWMSYTYRRLRERPRNIFLLGRAIKDQFSN